jgi:hypothetical protein
LFSKRAVASREDAGELARLPGTRGLDHLSQLLRDFTVYYDEYRGHTALGGAIPSVIHRGGQRIRPGKLAKALPPNIERRLYPDALITAYRRVPFLARTCSATSHHL